MDQSPPYQLDGRSCGKLSQVFDLHGWDHILAEPPNVHEHKQDGCSNC